MKKFFYFAFAALLCCGFTACEKDDDNGGIDIKNLYGQWTTVKAVWTEYGESGVETFAPGEYIMCFNEDGTGYEQFVEDAWTYGFNYTVSGDKLRVRYEDDPELFIVTIKLLDSEQFVFCEEGTDEDGYYKYESYLVRYE